MRFYKTSEIKYLPQYVPPPFDILEAHLQRNAARKEKVQDYIGKIGLVPKAIPEQADVQFQVADEYNNILSSLVDKLEGTSNFEPVMNELYKVKQKYDTDPRVIDLERNVLIREQDIKNSERLAANGQLLADTPGWDPKVQTEPFYTKDEEGQLIPSRLTVKQFIPIPPVEKDAETMMKNIKQTLLDDYGFYYDERGTLINPYSNLGTTDDRVKEIAEKKLDSYWSANGDFFTKAYYESPQYSKRVQGLYSSPQAWAKDLLYDAGINQVGTTAKQVRGVSRLFTGTGGIGKNTKGQYEILPDKTTSNIWLAHPDIKNTKDVQQLPITTNIWRLQVSKEKIPTVIGQVPWAYNLVTNKVLAPEGTNPRAEATGEQEDSGKYPYAMQNMVFANVKEPYTIENGIKYYYEMVFDEKRGTKGRWIFKKTTTPQRYVEAGMASFDNNAEMVNFEAQYWVKFEDYKNYIEVNQKRKLLDMDEQPTTGGKTVSTKQYTAKMPDGKIIISKDGISWIYKDTGKEVK